MTAQLVKDQLSHETIEAARQIYEGARAGLIKGMVFGITLGRGRYFVNSAGDCHRDPTRARGILAAADDELAALIHARGADSTI